MKQKHLGLFILLLVIAVTVGYMFFQKSQPDDIYINGYLGGEKIGIYENPQFIKYIKDTYGLEMDYKKSGSLAMVRGNSEGMDYLFPSSQLALEVYKKSGKASKTNEIVFNSPIVLYSRKAVVDAFIKEGIVKIEEGIYYVDMVKLADMIVNEKSWADIGLPEIYGNILVDTTDPNESNSGNMFLGLLANSLNGGKVVDRASLKEIKPKIEKIYNIIGYMQTSSADMFSQFLKLGVGAYPIIAGYESQILEFSKIESETYNKIKDDIFILYPRPTVWSSHVYISLTDKGEVGLKALLDPKVQEIAWNEHGFRTVVSGTENTENFQVEGLAKDIINVIPLPDTDAMLELMDAVK